MHRFFVLPEQIKEENITITGEDVKHISQVLRLSPGKKIIICDGQGKEYCCIINGVNKDTVAATVLSVSGSDNELSSNIYLFQGVPKQDKMTLIVQKSIELGIYRIIPVMTARSIVKMDHHKKDAKTDRWQKIAEAAAKQSHRSIIPEVEISLSFQEALERAKGLDKIIVAYENAEGIAYTRKVISELTKGESIGIFIGPEGGFEDWEVRSISELGGHVVSLGKRILRTETAGLAILSSIMMHLEED